MDGGVPDGEELWEAVPWCTAMNGQNSLRRQAKEGDDVDVHGMQDTDPTERSVGRSV